MGQLLEIEREMIELGYRIVAVSPDRPTELSKTIDANELTYTLLSDSSMVGAQTLGIAERFGSIKVAAYKLNNQNIETASGQDHHLIPVPSVFIIDKSGIIRFAHTDNNHRKRIDAVEILSMAKRLVKG
ncbi:MAG: redoxin domain-containing protein [Candidatus Marinimicrobia bacterium]|nr:redoxin domain-containing protein [Candidatus Neomarinimicrobiota bacterium]MBT4359513.1 redoxin domain-containing protein [Candidatus Neomarinimicrobiota bacterium]MBT4714837.1 redoxin domain-containing protein [Candidatus Neomarinimicrobiota bacterium]MBT4945761.1 redoxin domain-containing protein [Candidatus Neomarinimicrobiota bacterium]MBT5314952.1 redoxin domain-containing protein [Candidatus Neomarinimicrobiota bacterium]